MSKRWIVGCTAGAIFLFVPAQSHSQAADVLLKKCTRSLSMATACLILDQGVTKVVEIGLGRLIDHASGRRDALKREEMRPSDVKVEQVEASGIEWSKLEEFLRSVFSPVAPTDDGQARSKVAASCAANYIPVCRHLGIPEPRHVVDCSKIQAKEACEVTMACSWKNSSCSKHGGTRELFGR